MNFAEFRRKNKVMRSKVIRKVPVEPKKILKAFINWKSREHSDRRNVRAQFSRFKEYMDKYGYNKVYTLLMGNQRVLNMSHKDRIGMIQMLADL